jgi:hypothetical protein
MADSKLLEFRAAHARMHARTHTHAHTHTQHTRSMRSTSCASRRSTTPSWAPSRTASPPSSAPRASPPTSSPTTSACRTGLTTHTRPTRVHVHTTSACRTGLTTHTQTTTTHTQPTRVPVVQVLYRLGARADRCTCQTQTQGRLTSPLLHRRRCHTQTQGHADHPRRTALSYTCYTHMARHKGTPPPNSSVLQLLCGAQLHRLRLSHRCTCAALSDGRQLPGQGSAHAPRVATCAWATRARAPRPRPCAAPSLH